MGRKRLGKTLNTHELNALIQPYRRLDNYTNLLYVGQEHLSLLLILGSAVWFFQQRAALGLHWAWSIPAYLLSLMLVGAVQHRLAGLGHEGAHYILFRNRYMNELVSDLCCMFPLFASTEQYRLIHLGHHQYVNDWDRDPELLNLGKTRMMDRFPMGRAQFIFNFFIRLMWPPALLRYMWDNIYVTVLGKGVHPYGEEAAKRHGPRQNFRLTTVLGVLCIAFLVPLMWYVSAVAPLWVSAVVPVLVWAVSIAVIYTIPQKWFFQSPLKRPVFSSRFSSVLRLGFYIGLIGLLGWLRAATGIYWALYFWTLWVVPLFTTFPCYMLIRDIFQHANADDGRLTNSRVFFCDPITRWAFFVYGQDMHLTHHLYAAVPHYNLTALHRMLMTQNTEYSQHVVECHGMFWNGDGRTTMVDVMEVPTCEPDSVEAPGTPAANGKPQDKPAEKWHEADATA